VSFDGAGYGADGKIWGGEFLLCEGARFRRLAHLEYVRMIGGDSSVKEGWKSAMCYAFAHECGCGEKEREAEAEIADGSESVSVDISEIIAYSSIRKRAEWELVRAALEHKVNTIESSSAGRLFDAVASLLGIHHVNRYEGECAIMLENAAEEALRRPGENRACGLALEFHRGVAKLILEQCVKARESTGVSAVALSGGVFQNKILMEESLRLLRARGFDAYRNISAPPNDGGLSLGQAYIGMRCLRGIPRGGEKITAARDVQMAEL
jgi:hydrogenase maturation protein HypF